MKEPLKELTVIAAPPGKVLLLLSGFWAGWGTVFFLNLTSVPELIRLFAATVVGLIFAFFSLCIFLTGYTKWHRPMTDEEREEWKKENAKKAAAIRATREEQERRRKEQEELREDREKARAASIIALRNFLSSLEGNPQAAKLLARLHAGSASQGTVNRALANPDIILAGIGSWLERRGRHNNLPDVGFPKSSFKGEVEGPLDDLFDQLGPKERGTFLDILSQGAELAEEALTQGVSQREILELLLPLILS